MSEEEIRKLSEAYADYECGMSKHTGKKLQQLHEDKIIEFFDVWGFLIETHCIVPKSKVTAVYEEAQEWLKEKPNEYNNTLKVTAIALQDRLEGIFGKDLFDEKGE